MACIFHLGYYPKTYNEITDGSKPISNTSIEVSSTPEWMDTPITPRVITSVDTNLVSLGEEITAAIGTLVFNGGDIFQYDYAALYAAELVKDGEAFFSLYIQDNETKEFTPYEGTGEILKDGTYGVLFTRVKTITLPSIAYKDAVTQATISFSELNIDFNSTTSAFTLNSPTGYYVASLSWALGDATGVPAAMLPALPKYFYVSGDFTQNSYVRNFPYGDPTISGNTTTKPIWDMKVFSFIGMLSPAVNKPQIKWQALCYETGKAPSKIYSTYYGTVDRTTVLKTTTSNVQFLNKTPDLESHYDASNLSWPGGVGQLIPNDATINMDETSSISRIGENSDGIQEHQATYYVYPSKYIVSKAIYIDNTPHTNTTTTINIDSTTFRELFPVFEDANVGTAEEPDPIQVVINRITNQDNTVNNWDQPISFADIYNTSSITLAGYYDRYIKITIQYHGLRIYKGSKNNVYIWSSDQPHQGEYYVPSEDFIISTDRNVSVDTRNLGSKLVDAASFTSVVKTTDINIYTGGVDGRLNFLDTTDQQGNPETKVERTQTIPSFFTKGTKSSFFSFKEQNTSWLNGTLKNFIEKVPDRTLHVYGEFLPKQYAKPSTSGSNINFSVTCRLQTQDNVDFPGSSYVKIEFPIIMCYGRSFTYKSLINDYVVPTNNLQFDCGDYGVIKSQQFAFSSFGSEKHGEIASSVLLRYEINHDAGTTTLTGPFTTNPYYAYFIKMLDVSTITIPAAEDMLTVKSTQFPDLYAQYTWPAKPGQTTTIELPTDLVESSLSNLIQGGPFFLISSGNKAASKNTYSDITLVNSKYFPTKVIHNDFTTNEGFIDRTSGTPYDFKYGFDFTGIMGMYCTAFGLRSSNTQSTYTVAPDCLNNGRAKVHIHDTPFTRKRFILAAVGAGGSGATGYPQILWCRSSGGGGGGGSFGMWYIDLEKMAKAAGTTYESIKMKISGGVGGQKETNENYNGYDGQDLKILFTDRNDKSLVEFTIYAGKKGRTYGSHSSCPGGEGGAAPIVEFLNSSCSSAVKEIFMRAGAPGLNGDIESDRINSQDKDEYAIPETLVISPDDYKDFMYIKNNFLGIYLDKSIHGDYPTEVTYTLDVSDKSFETCRTYHVEKAEWEKARQLLKAEQDMKSWLNNPYEKTPFQLFYGNYYNNRYVAVDYCALGGTGAPSMCGFPTYWLLEDGKRDRFPSSAKMTSTEQQFYNDNPCPGCGGCGGSATYNDWFEDTGKNRSDGRPGGHAYWAIFC